MCYPEKSFQVAGGGPGWQVAGRCKKKNPEPEFGGFDLPPVTRGCHLPPEVD